MMPIEDKAVIAIQRLFKAGGCYTQQMIATTRCLTKSFQCERFAPQHFNVIAENTPFVLSEIIANYQPLKKNITVGEFRVLVFDGLITPEWILNSIVISGGKIKSQYPNLPDDFGAFSQINDETNRLCDQLRIAIRRMIECKN